MPLWLKFFLAAIGVAYTGFFLLLANAPFLDTPSHLARAVIMKSLWFDANSPFQGVFSAKKFFMPYILPDLELIVLLRVLGTDLAYPVWSALTMLAVALAVWFYARQLLAASWAVAAAILCSWYFATNYLFILGFVSFEWGLAFAFIALGALHSWRAGKGKSFGWIAVYGTACLATYGAHSAAFAILMALAGAIGFVRILRKEQSWIRFSCELLPFAILAAYHLFAVPAHPEENFRSTAHSPAFNKIGRYFGSIFLRQAYFVDLALLLLFLGIVLSAIWAARTRRASLSGHWELLTICGLASIGYFLLPVGLGSGWYVDERMLPFVFVPLLMLALGIFERSAPSRRQITFLIAACGLLTVGNLVSLALFLPQQNREVGQYRDALQTIPVGKKILPVDTRRTDARTRPLRHANSFYTVDRGGFTPYLFSTRTGGGPSGYFSDLSPVYRPDEDWYQTSAEPDWEKVSQTYDYVVVTKPWSAERIDRTRLEMYYDNSIAAVFRVRR